MAKDAVHDAGRDRVGLVQEIGEDAGHVADHELVHVRADNVGKAVKVRRDEVIGAGELADENNTLNRREVVEEIRVLVVVGDLVDTRRLRRLRLGVIALLARSEWPRAGLVLEVLGNLDDEKLEDVAELVAGVGRVGRVETQEVCEAARGVCLDAAVFVVEDDAINELLVNSVQRLQVCPILLEVFELEVQSLVVSYATAAGSLP